jgi:hypothetical protein
MIPRIAFEFEQCPLMAGFPTAPELMKDRALP